MSEIGDTWNAVKESRRELRELFGVPCPECVEKLPKANPSILLPEQRCRIHGFRDPRPRSETTDIYENAGFEEGELEKGVAQKTE